MNKWSAHMLTGIEKMTRKMRAETTCRTDANGPACRRGEARGLMRVARFAVVAVMVMVFGLTGLVQSADAAVTTLDAFPNTPQASSGTVTASGTWTISAGSDRLLVMVVAVNDGANATHTATTITYGGKTLSPASTSPGTGRRDAITFYLKETDIATRANDNFTVTVAPASTGTSVYLGSFTGVDQTTPVGATYSFYNNNNSATINFGTGLAVLDGGAAVFGLATNTAAQPTVSDSFTVTNFFTNGTSNIVGTREYATAVTSNPNITYGGTFRGGIGAFVINPGGPTCAATAPSNLAGSDLAGAPVEVPLSWTADCTNNNTYTVYRDGVALVAGTDITCSAGTMNFTDAFVTPTTSYAYTVRGTNTAGACESADSNTVNVTTNACSESTPSIVWTAQSTASGDFSGSPFVTLTNVTGGSMEYQVTEGSGSPPAFSTYTENFATGNNFGSWVATDTDATAGKDWLTLNGQTPSGTNTVGPTVDQSGSGFFAYTESTGGTNPTTFYLASPSIDNATYATNLDFYWNKNHNGATYCELYVDASSDNGATWDNLAIWNPTPPTVESGSSTLWTRETLDLSGITPTGAQNNIKVRFRTVTGGFECDTAVDTVTIDGTPRATETTVIPWTADPVPGMANLTSGNTYNLYARGLSGTCGVSTYGDTVANGTTPGNPTTFDWTSCTETATVAAVNPGVLSGATTITATLGGSGGSAPQVRWSIDGGAFSGWAASGATLTPPGGTTGNITIEARATGSCGTIIDLTPVNTTYNTICTETATVAAVNPGVLTGATAITATLGGTGGSAPQVRWSIDGGAFSGWAGSGATLTPPALSTGTIVIEARATGFCGAITDLTPVNTTYDTTCTETASVTLGAITDPISAAVGITATGAGGAFNILVGDTDPPVNASGWTYTPPVASAGLVTFYAEADGICGKVTDSRIVTYNTNLGLIAEVATLSQVNPTTVRVVMPFSGDSNLSGTFTVQYKLTSSGSYTNHVVDAANSGLSPYITVISGLVEGSSYNIRVTYKDAADGVTGSPAIQTLGPITLVSWTDNPMLHNSNRFACSDGAYQNAVDCVANAGTWDPNKRYTGGWGTPTGQYGEFTCGTCHMKDSTNIKRIKNTTIATVSGTIPGSTQAVTLTSTVDTSADFGETAGNHAVSNKICEVCHTYNPATAGPTGGVRYHGYNMAGATVANQTHQLDSDCIKCHEHKSGFRASCTSCHGNPPINAGTLDTTSNAGAGTGSITAGAHDVHVNTLGYIDCNTCHTGWEAAGEMPKADDSGDINIGFSTFGSTAGTYTGQAAATYNGVAGSGTLTCNTVYCHGGTLSGTAPVWNTPASGACGTCHKMTGATVSALPSGTSHNTHANAQGLTCDKCHGAGFGGAGHVNGSLSWDVSTLPSGSSPTYFGSASGETFGRAPSAGYGTCSNIACHNNVVTPTWNGTANCTTCHATPPVTGAHAKHYTAKGWASPDPAGTTCDACHPDNTVAHSDVTDATIQLDAGLGWNGVAKTCSTTSTGCHNGNTTPNWTTTNIACTNCHTVGGSNTATVANPVTGLHNISAANVTGGVTKHDSTLAGGCTACHVKANISQHWNGVASATPSYTSAQSGVATITGGSYTDNAGTGANRGTCATSCHSDGGNWARQWSTAANSIVTTVGNARCDVCHGQWTTWAAGTTHYKAGGTNSAGNTRGNGHDCTNCHAYVTARHDTTPTHQINLNNNGAVPGRTNNTYGSGTAGCGSCHGNQTNATYNFPISYFAANYVAGGVVTGPACSSCHTNGAMAATVPQVSGTSTHVKVTTTGTFGDCTNCHSGHSGGVSIPNNATVGINYALHGGINLGGSGTNALISALTTEAQICWACHAGAGSGVDGEFGANTKANTGNLPYNYGTLNNTNGNVNWIGATWRSGTAKFTYKQGPIQSIHTANPQALGGPSLNTGDTVGQIRCSYCHDVHNLNKATGDTLSGAPYLRGTWRGNPYREDGAPQTGDTWTTTARFGAVPRGTTASVELGGYQIDQNNGNPTNGWTANSSAGLCELCHGNGDGNFTAAEIDALNQFGTASTDWVGTNGHSAAVLGGGDSVAANIFSVADRNTTAPTVGTGSGTSAGNPAMAYQQVSGGTGARAFGFRSNASEPDGWNLTPRISALYAHDTYNWGANTQSALDANYHNFSCSKCHNPHASRLPRLMITNCLDTKQNTWDNGQGTIPSATTVNGDGGATPSANNALVKFSNVTSAQNCHRVKDPQYTQSRGAGWNRVTPWGTSR